MKNRIAGRAFKNPSKKKFLKNNNKGIETEEIQIYRNRESRVQSKKERLTNDVRYQDSNEVTLGLMRKSRQAEGYFIFILVCARRGAFLLPGRFPGMTGTRYEIQDTRYKILGTRY